MMKSVYVRKTVKDTNRNGFAIASMELSVIGGIQIILTV